MIQHVIQTARALLGNIRGKLGVGHPIRTGASQSTQSTTSTSTRTVTEETRNSSTTPKRGSLTTLGRSSSLPAGLSQSIRCQARLTDSARRSGPDLARTSLHTKKQPQPPSHVHTHSCTCHGQSSPIPTNHSMPALRNHFITSQSEHLHSVYPRSPTSLLPHKTSLHMPHSDSLPLFPHQLSTLKQEKLQSAIGRIKQANLNVDLSCHLTNNSCSYPSLTAGANIFRDGLKADSSGYWSRLDVNKKHLLGSGLLESRSMLTLAANIRLDHRFQIERFSQSMEDDRGALGDVHSNDEWVSFFLADSDYVNGSVDEDSHNEFVNSIPTLDRLDSADSGDCNFKSDPKWPAEGKVDNSPHCLTLVGRESHVVTQDCHGDDGGCACAQLHVTDDTILLCELKPIIKSFSEVCTCT